MRSIVLFTTVFLAGSALCAAADERSRSAKGSSAETAPERETAALAFVRENHPELAQLLEQLKPMKPVDYDRAIGEIYSVGKTLGKLKEHDPKRYAVGLELWKARSRVELLTAKLISAPSAELEGKLREAVANQLEVEIRQQKLEREQAEARLQKLNANIERLESNQGKIIENRYQALVKQRQRARRQEKGKSAPAPAAPAQAKKAENKA